MSERDRVRIRTQPSQGGGQRSTENSADQTAAPLGNSARRVDPEVLQGASARSVSGAGASQRRPTYDSGRSAADAPPLPNRRVGSKKQVRQKPSSGSTPPAAPPPQDHPDTQGRKAPRLDGKRDLKDTVVPRGSAFWTGRSEAQAEQNVDRGNPLFLQRSEGKADPRGPLFTQKSKRRGEWQAPWKGKGWFTAQVRGEAPPVREVWKAPWDDGETVFDGLEMPTKGLEGWFKSLSRRGESVMDGLEWPTAGLEGWFESLNKPGTSVMDGLEWPTAGLEGWFDSLNGRGTWGGLPWFLRLIKKKEIKKASKQQPPRSEEREIPPGTRVYPSVRGDSSMSDTQTSASQRVYPSVRGGSTNGGGEVESQSIPFMQTGNTSRSWKSGDIQAGPEGVQIDTHIGPPERRVQVGEEPPGGQGGGFSGSMSSKGRPARATVLRSQDKMANPDIEKEQGVDEPEDESSERIAPSPWMGALGYAMQYLIADAKRGTQSAADYIAKNNPLQEIGAQLAQLNEADPFKYPSLQDIVDVMQYTARHIVGYYDKQRRELGFDTLTLFHEVGLVHNFQAYNRARNRINDLLEAGELEPYEIGLLTSPKSQINEDRWENIKDKKLRKDMQTVLQSSTLYIDTGPQGQTHYYWAVDGVRPDIVRVLTNKGDAEMPYLVDALDYIITGHYRRRNIQDFERWVQDPVNYVNGGQITALEALDRFCQRLAAGDAYVFIDEVKTHPGDFSRYHSEIDFALGHVPGPGKSLIDTGLGADIAGTTHALKHLMENGLNYNIKQILEIARHMKAGFTEISLDMFQPDTFDTIHAGALDIAIPVPRIRTYGVGYRELHHGWKRRENSIISKGRIATTGNAYILPYNPNQPF